MTYLDCLSKYLLVIGVVNFNGCGIIKICTKNRAQDLYKNQLLHYKIYDLLTIANLNSADNVMNGGNMW